MIPSPTCNKTKSEKITLENDIGIPQQTVYYHEPLHSDEFIKKEEEINLKLLKKQWIIPISYYPYDKQFHYENGKPKVRPILIDSITHIVINDVILDKEDFGKKMVGAFLESSLEGIPQEAIITDGDRMYAEILEKIGVKHQICIFHVIKKSPWQIIQNHCKTQRRIQTINNQNKQQYVWSILKYGKIIYLKKIKNKKIRR